MLDRDKGVASFYDRYEKTLTRHADLKTLVHPDSRSEDLRKELEMFFRGFMSRNRCDTKKDAWEAAAVATLMRMADLSMAAHLEVSKALLFGSGLSGGRLAEAAARVEKGGEMGDRAAVAADLSDINFVGILGVATALICSCDADGGQADDVVRAITALDLEGCERITDAIATERAQWDRCTRELGEKPFATYIRMTNFKRSLAALERFERVAEEFEFITAHRSELKLSKIKDWRVIERLIIEAAVVVARTNTDDSSYSASASDSGSNASAPSAFHMQPGQRQEHAGSTPAEIANAIKKIKAEGKDIESVCSICGEKAVHTVDKQVEFASKGWTNTPRKCTGCTDEQNKSRVCFDFQNGRSCRKGDLCRFSHSNAMKEDREKMNVRHASVDSELSSSDEYGDY